MTLPRNAWSPTRLVRSAAVATAAASALYILTSYSGFRLSASLTLMVATFSASVLAAGLATTYHHRAVERDDRLRNRRLAILALLTLPAAADLIWSAVSALLSS